MSFQWINIGEDLQKLIDILLPDLEERFGETEERITVTVSRRKKGLKVKTDGRNAVIEYSKKVEFARALGLLRERLSTKDYEGVEELPVFDKLTLMQDNSRNSVSNISSVKKMLRHMALMGYHSLQLYTEDTYEIEGEPFWGYFRGRYSAEELKELNEYGQILGIELVPCIQTLAHLNAIFQWKTYQEIRDTGDILLCGEDRTYELIEKMIKTCADTFTSRQINIGMDEAEMLGRGRYLEKFSYEERFSIMTTHLNKVLDLCRKYGFEAMMWSDMFFKMLSGGGYHAVDLEITEEAKAKIPKDVSLVYWDYYTRDKEKYDKMLSKHKEMNDKIIFAGGAWRWNGYAPLLHHSLLCGKLALPSCKEHGIGEVLITAWGDNGSECSGFVVTPIMQQYAEYCYGQTTEEETLAPRLYTTTGMRYEDFMLLDYPNLTPDNPSPGRVSVGPAKYLLYQDILLGIYDAHIDEITYPEHFRTYASRLKDGAARAGEYAYIFNTLSALCNVLETKCDLGIQLKQAYDKKDSEGLRAGIEKCYETLERIQQFHEAVQIQWHIENKSFGFEVIDLRLGGLKERVKRAANKVEKYLSGEVPEIEELTVERLLLDERENPPYRTLPLYHNNWADMVSASVI